MDQDFVVLMTALPTVIDSRTVESASQYRLMRMLGRPLTGLSQLAEVEGDAAASWTIENDHRTYTFTIASGSRFSDGSPITPDDVVATLDELRQKGKAVHFDFTSVVSIKVLPPNKVRIELKAPNRRLINMVAFPEFSVLHRSDRGLPDGKQTHAVTSGPYRLTSMTSERIVLEKNPYYSPFSSTAPSRVVVIGQDRADVVAMIRAKQIHFLDFFLRKEIYDTAKAAGYGTFLPRMAHTSFVSINSQRPHLATREARRVIQEALSAGKVDLSGLWHKWEPALELYLPGGPGRLSNERLAQIWGEIAKADKHALTTRRSLVLITSPNYAEAPRVIEALGRAGISCELRVIARGDLRKVVLGGDYDLFLSANDFAAKDVLENIQVTLSADFPMVTTQSSSAVPSLVEEAMRTFDEPRHYELLQKISETLLVDANLVPLAYQPTVHYVAPGWDLSRWSTMYPDLAPWKLERQSAH